MSYNLVLPSGQQVYVSNNSYPDLFFGLKVIKKSRISVSRVCSVTPGFLQGGLNNFGIVTNITLEAHPQTMVYVSQFN